MSIKQEANLIDFEALLTKQVKCFQHCLKSERIICFEMPDKCPTCTACLNSMQDQIKFRVPPFILPSPLTVTSSKEKHHVPSFSLLLQPTDGNYSKFLKENSQIHNLNKDIGDLHIGITNSKCEIYDFNINGTISYLNTLFCLAYLFYNLNDN
jgi:hypothetical protein